MIGSTETTRKCEIQIKYRILLKLVMRIYICAADYILCGNINVSAVHICVDYTKRVRITLQAIRANKYI